MAEEQARKTIGDYVMYQGSVHFSSIAIPAIAKALEIDPGFLTFISAHQFTAMEHEDPYSHLNTFYELVGVMGFESNDVDNVVCACFLFHWQERLKIGLDHFQFKASLTGRM